MKPARMLPTVTFGVAISFFFVPPVLALIGASPAPVRTPVAKLSVEGRIGTNPPDTLDEPQARNVEGECFVRSGRRGLAPTNSTRQALHTVVASLPPGDIDR